MTCAPAAGLRRLPCRYGKVEAVRSVSLEVGDNEIVTIIGANGAGKTTLLNAIMGVLPLKGACRFARRGRRTARDRGPRRRRPEPGAGTSRVVRDHERARTISSSAPSASPRPTRQRSFEKVYTLFPRLKERRKQLAGTLSGGEQQMLAMGRALMGEPKLLMLDEPSLGLAPIIVADIFRTVTELRASRRLGAAGRAERAGRAADRRPRLCDGARRVRALGQGHRHRRRPPRRRELSRRLRERVVPGHRARKSGARSVRRILRPTFTTSARSGSSAPDRS